MMKLRDVALGSRVIVPEKAGQHVLTVVGKMHMTYGDYVALASNDASVKHYGFQQAIAFIATDEVWDGFRDFSWFLAAKDDRECQLQDHFPNQKCFSCQISLPHTSHSICVSCAAIEKLS